MGGSNVPGKDNMRTTKHSVWIGISLAFCVVLAGCGRSGSGEPAATSTPPPSAATSEGAGAAAPAKGGVEWFEGSLDAAFAKAQAEHKPVLINWTAHWCPYCMALKATVFTRPDFIAQTANVVAVEDRKSTRLNSSH